MNTRIKTILHNPFLLFMTLGHREWFNWIDDKTYLKIAYWCRFHKPLNLNEPKTFNEKLQWLKLYDRKPLYTKLVDKYEVKSYVSNLIGAKYIIPTLGVWENFDDIDFSILPNQFVIKCTHDSGGLIICKDKSRLDLNKARAIITQCLKHSFFWGQREWPYKNVPPRIIAEKYMEDESGYELKDYKIFCFDGEPHFIEVDFGRFSEHKRNLYDAEWNLLDLQIKFPKGHERVFDKPSNLDEMLGVARKLSKGIPHVRVDLYNINGQLYFGEMTFFHGTGMELFTPESWNRKFGELINLPSKNK